MPEFDTGVTRRDFLKAGALSAGALTLGLPEHLLAAHSAAGQERQCILLFLVGGPSHLDTWDPKPHAPAEVRGPFRPIRTNVTGIHLSENFPRMARCAERYALIRSVHHAEAPIHETGQQLLQTGRLFQNGVDHPHYGAVLSHLYGPRQTGVPPWLVLPAPISNTGVSVGHGQTAGYLGARHDALFVQGEPGRTDALEVLDAVEAIQRPSGTPVVERPTLTPAVQRALDVSREKRALRERYGGEPFGQSCLAARRLVEQGVRLVTVNMFDSVFNKITWDCHADGGALGTDLDDYRDTLCPLFDRAYTALLEDLAERGMLENTLVLAMGEFGRTPHLNPRGGRDHWPGCWSILMAGGGIRGGQVVGASDAIGAEPKERPVTPAEVAATVYTALGVDTRTQLPGPDGMAVPLVDAAPLKELF